MRCRSALKRIGPFIDGELTAAEAKALREHLGACASCSRRCALMRSLIREVSSLPAIVPTPEETYRLTNRLRREMAQPAPPAPARRRVQLATAALTLLVLATVAGIGLAVWSGGGPTPIAEEAALEGVDGGQAARSAHPSDAGDRGGDTARQGLEVATARPALISSGREYAAADLEDFRNDLGTRLDFYSAYWYPAPGTPPQSAALKRLQGDLTADLAEQAAAAGHEPDELERAVTAALTQAGDKPVLPCYAELARMEGKEVWLISVSGPEDCLLFHDRDKPPAMALASLGGEESLKINESVLRELAAWLAPSGNGSAPALPVKVPKNERAVDGDVAAEEAPDAGLAAGVEGASPDGETAREAEDFQSFLRRLAAQGTSLDIISALKKLSGDQLLLLLQGNWAALAAESVNLGDFLAPPQRLWAVDRSSGTVLWEAGR